MHLSDEEIMGLSGYIDDYEISEEDEIAKFEHIQNCDECYKKYCIFSTLADAISPEGIVSAVEYYSEMNSDHVKEGIEAIKNNLLVRVRGIRNKLETGWTLIEDAALGVSDIFRFEQPMLAMAARGIDDTNDVSRIEDINYTDSYMILDRSNDQLLVQIDKEQLSDREIAVYLIYENNESVKINMEDMGKEYQGMIDLKKDVEFKIEIVEI